MLYNPTRQSREAVAEQHLVRKSSMRVLKATGAHSASSVDGHNETDDIGQ